MATIIAKLQSQTATKPHRHSHLPMPTEEEMEEIIDIIDKHRNNPPLLKKMEEATPPHIMEALLNYSAKKTKEQKIRTAKAEQWAREVKHYTTP